jgi:hypothetical protein
MLLIRATITPSGNTQRIHNVQDRTPSEDARPVERWQDLRVVRDAGQLASPLDHRFQFVGAEPDFGAAIPDRGFDLVRLASDKNQREYRARANSVQSRLLPLLGQFVGVINEDQRRNSLVEPLLSES